MALRGGGAACDYQPRCLCQNRLLPREAVEVADYEPMRRRDLDTWAPLPGLMRRSTPASSSYGERVADPGGGCL